MQFNDVPSWTDWQKASSSFMQRRAAKPWLVAIDKAVKAYPAASDKRRALRDLACAIREWDGDKVERGASTGRGEAMAALFQIVRTKLDQLPPTKAYDEAVCIGYDIPTGQFQAVPGRLGVAYSGVDDEQNDLRARADQIKSVIQTAYKAHTNARLNGRIDAEAEKKWLKIFMAPEFLFRGKSGAYAIERLWDVLPLVREETQKSKYADWLFVVGSCVCFTVKTGAKDTNKEQGIILENFALVQKGGWGASDGVHDRYVEKEYVSHIDYDRPEDGLPGSNWGSASRKVAVGGRDRSALPPPGSRDLKGKLPNWTSKSLREANNGCIFEMDGISFGLEVCLDHLNGRLSAAPDKDRVQIQLIPSAGADIEVSNCCANSIVFNVDGGGNHHVKLYDNRNNAAVARPQAFVVNAPASQAYFPGDAGKLAFYKPLPIP